MMPPLPDISLLNSFQGAEKKNQQKPHLKMLEVLKSLSHFTYHTDILTMLISEKGLIVL